MMRMSASGSKRTNRWGQVKVFAANWNKVMASYLTDEELLDADINTLTAEQMKKRHRALQSRHALPGPKLEHLTEDQIAHIMRKTELQRPDLIERAQQAGSTYRLTKDETALEEELFKVQNDVLAYCEKIGFPKDQYATAIIFTRISILVRLWD